MPDPEPPNEPRSYAGLGVIFVIVLALGAMYLVNRMRHYAQLGDCAFTRAPVCRELIDR
jgi:hypothetical protein